MNPSRACIVLLLAAFAGLHGCAKPEPLYGVEQKLWLDGDRRQVWAIAPTINLSGQSSIDPLLQSDLVYQQLQTVEHLTVIPVNRVAEVYSTLNINKVQSEEQAAIVCDLLGADALVVPTITIFDPYNPPKFGASLQLLRGNSDAASAVATANVNPRELSRQATSTPDQPMAQQPSFKQSVGMFDAANGSVRDALAVYAAGRNDPLGPLGSKEYLVNMDRYCGFVYYQLIEDLIR